MWAVAGQCYTAGILLRDGAMMELANGTEFNLTKIAIEISISSWLSCMSGSITDVYAAQDSYSLDVDAMHRQSEASH